MHVHEIFPQAAHLQMEENVGCPKCCKALLTQLAVDQQHADAVEDQVEARHCDCTDGGGKHPGIGMAGPIMPTRAIFWREGSAWVRCGLMLCAIDLIIANLDDDARFKGEPAGSQCLQAGPAACSERS